MEQEFSSVRTDWMKSVIFKNNEQIHKASAFQIWGNSHIDIHEGISLISSFWNSCRFMKLMCKLVAYVHFPGFMTVIYKLAM